MSTAGCTESTRHCEVTSVWVWTRQCWRWSGNIYPRHLELFSEQSGQNNFGLDPELCCYWNTAWTWNILCGWLWHQSWQQYLDQVYTDVWWYHWQICHQELHVAVARHQQDHHICHIYHYFCHIDVWIRHRNPDDHWSLEDCHNQVSTSRPGREAPSAWRVRRHLVSMLSVWSVILGWRWEGGEQGGPGNSWHETGEFICLLSETNQNWQWHIIKDLFYIVYLVNKMTILWFVTVTWHCCAAVSRDKTHKWLDHSHPRHCDHVSVCPQCPVWSSDNISYGNHSLPLHVRQS